MPLCPVCGSERSIHLNDERSLFECLSCNSRFHKFYQIVPDRIEFDPDARCLTSLPFEMQEYFFDIYHNKREAMFDGSR